jgi:hypothetical protein
MASNSVVVLLNSISTSPEQSDESIDLEATGFDEEQQVGMDLRASVL